MDDFISIEKLISQAKKGGVDFGSGDPYNRLRYYTKIGWLPHMVRKSDKKGDIKGHYPTWAVERLILIEDLKSKGFSNEDIDKKINVKNRLQGISRAITSPESRKQIVSYLILAIVVLIFANELQIIKLGKQKGFPISNTETQLPSQITASGTAFVPKNQKKIFVKSATTTQKTKVYITFTQNYSPASRFWVSGIEEGKGFLLETDAPVFENTEFNWWLSE